MNHVYNGYEPYKGEMPGRRTGALVSMENGSVTAYALESLQERGRIFVEPGTEVYVGMVVGESAKDSDMDVNPVRMKKLTNMRSSNAEINVKLTPPAILTLEQAMEFIEDDELMEVTPDSIRLRKRVLNKSFRTKKSAAV
jgi:GTP-binding protein